MSRWYRFWIKSSRGTDCTSYVQLPYRLSEEEVKEHLEEWCSKFSAWNVSDNHVSYGYEKVRKPPARKQKAREAMKITCRFDGRTLYECKADTMLAALQQAVKEGANLYGANLRDAVLYGANLYGANLRDADLRGANLRDADLRGTNLRDADLRGTNLRGADLYGANLYGANLRGAKVNWQSHAIISEILRRAAGHDVQKRMVAGLILVSPDWCWDKFLSIESDLRDWSITTLQEYVQDGDDAPGILLAEKARDA